MFFLCCWIYSNLIIHLRQQRHNAEAPLWILFGSWPFSQMNQVQTVRLQHVHGKVIQTDEWRLGYSFKFSSVTVLIFIQQEGRV